MRKLKLDVDALQVESFMIRPDTEPAGTVHGHVPLPPDNKIPPSDRCDGGGWGSLFGTCEGCPTVGTCVGPTYCCTPTWRPTCVETCETCYTDCWI